MAEEATELQRLNDEIALLRKHLKRADERFFTCPKCGCHNFGSSGNFDDNSAIGHCHGELGCNYTWNRSMDEELGFIEPYPVHRGEWQ